MVYDSCASHEDSDTEHETRPNTGVHAHITTRSTPDEIYKFYEKILSSTDSYWDLLIWRSTTQSTISCHCHWETQFALFMGSMSIHHRIVSTSHESCRWSVSHDMGIIIINQPLLVIYGCIIGISIIHWRFNQPWHHRFQSNSIQNTTYHIVGWL
jgi:hypothetical protein